MPLNISGMAEVRVVKFCAFIAYIKCWPWKGRGQGHVAKFRINSRNIFEKAKATDFKFCVRFGQEVLTFNDQLSPKWACSEPRDAFWNFTPREISLERLKSSNFVCLQAMSNVILRGLTIPERSVARVMWSILEFCIPLNFSGMAEDGIVKFCARVGRRSISRVMTNSPPSEDRWYKIRALSLTGFRSWTGADVFCFPPSVGASDTI